MSTDLQLSYSSITTFQQCPRKYFFGYIKRRIAVAEAPALSFGKALHKLLELIWQGDAEGYAKALLTECSQMDDQSASRLTAMLAGYKKPDDWKVIETEAKFSVEITDPVYGEPLPGVKVIGYVDGIIENKKGKAILEHKSTAQEITGYGAYWKRLKLDCQVSIYAMGLGIRKVMYNAFHKPTITMCGTDEKASIKTGIPVSDCYLERCRADIAGNMKRYYQFREIERYPAEIEEAKKDLYDDALTIIEAHDKDRFPRRAISCQSFFGTCKYLDVCCGYDSIDSDNFMDKPESDRVEGDSE